MDKRDKTRTVEPLRLPEQRPAEPVRPPAGGAAPLHPVHHLQQTIGNDLTGVVLARQAADQATPRPGSAAAAALDSPDAGRPLPLPLRASMERAFGTDLSQVRTHTDAPAAGAARELHAEAFTRGQDIYFGAGQYRPGTTGGQRLLAHEVAHTVQDAAPDAVRTRPAVSRPGDAVEQQAEAASRRVAAGIDVAPGTLAPPRSQAGGAPQVARQAVLDGPPLPPPPLVTTAPPPPPPPPRPLPERQAAGQAAAQAVREAGDETQRDRDETVAQLVAMLVGPETGGAAQAPAAAEEAAAEEGQTAAPEGEAETAEAAGAAEEGGEPAAPEGEGEEETAAEGEGGGAPAGGPAGALLMPEPPAELSPAAQGRLRQAQGQGRAAAAATATLPPAPEAVEGARAAVEEPDAEVQGRAENALVAALDQQPQPSPEIEQLCERIREVIRNKRPPDEDALVEAQPQEMAREAGGELNQSVQGDTERVAGSYDSVNQPVEGEPERPPQDLQTPPESVDTPPVNAEQAAPDAVPAENVSLEADVAAQQARIQQAGMASEPASLVQSGPIAEARQAQGELQETAERDPAEVLAEQQASLDQARGDMAALQEQALQALTQSRAGTVQRVGGRQQEMVGSEEQTREQTGAEARRLFEDARRQVNDLLNPLPRTAMEQWDAGVQVLSTQFRQDLDRVQDWIDERHSGVGGFFLGAVDYVTGLPDWVTEEYDRAERQFGDGVCDLIRRISTQVNGVIATCEAIIADARQRISDLFANLPAGLQAWAAEQQAQLGAQLDALHNQATETRDNFTRDLANRAAQSVQEVRQEIHELRQKAGGLVGRIADAINRFLEDPVKFIIEGLLELVGIPPAAFWAVVARIQQVISDIADDPLGFAGNLLAAIGQGFSQFFDHIGSHLLQGLLDWLFSGLGSVGVQVPSDFSLGSIITFFLQLMGLTWPNIRAILVRHIGERNVALIERVYELLRMFIDKGPEGIFEMIKEQLNPQTILDQVLQAAVDFLTEALIRQVTVRIIALFNPVGAVFQALEAIYRVLKWIFENAARIFSLVETVVNGIADILRGNIGGMANAVEGALVRLIAPVIDFLAGYIGLGDLPERIADVIRGFQERVLAIVDRVIGWLVERGRALLRAVGLGGEEEGQAEEGEYDGQIGRVVTYSAAGESHRLWIVGEAGAAVVMTASEEKPVPALLDEYEGMAAELADEEQRTNVTGLIQQARQIHSSLDTQADDLAQAVAGPEPDPAQTEAKDDAVESGEEQLASTLRQIREALGLVDPEQLKQQALDELETGAQGANLTSVDQLGALIAQVYQKYQEQGLKSLGASVPDEESASIEFTATASDPKRKFLAWMSIFAHGDEEAREYFKKQPRNETNAAIVVNQERFGEVVASDKDHHAEVNLLNASWDGAFDRALEVAADVGKSTITVLINRAPCHTTCTPVLIAIMRQARQNPLARNKIKFRLAPTGIYEPSGELTNEVIEERQEALLEWAQKYGKVFVEMVRTELPTAKYTQDTTTDRDLARLIAAGWDVAALVAREKGPTPFGRQLGQAAHRLAERVKAGSK